MSHKDKQEDKQIDCVAIGSAIYDILTHVDEAFLVKAGLIKGSMRLVSRTEMERVYTQVGPTICVSGGSAGNTASGLARLGVETVFIGKTAEDSFGKSYLHNMRSLGITCPVTPFSIEGGKPPDISTALSLVLVTPDGERTMLTYLGSAAHLTQEDIPPETLPRTKYVYAEGYLWDSPSARAACHHAFATVHRFGGKTVLSLSDGFCVERHKKTFLSLLQERHIDILFANDHEMKALFETSDAMTALKMTRGLCDLCVVTFGAQGAVCQSPTDHIFVPSVPTDTVVDLTGAGDGFATGFLYGLLKESSFETSLRFGHVLAHRIIQTMGAQLEGNLFELAAECDVI